MTSAKTSSRDKSFPTEHEIKRLVGEIEHRHGTHLRIHVLVVSDILKGCRIGSTHVECPDQLIEDLQATLEALKHAFPEGCTCKSKRSVN